MILQIIFRFCLVFRKGQTDHRLKIRNSFGFPLLFSKPQLLLSIWLNKIKVITVGIMMPAAAAAAKSLQSCPTLCDPIDGSPPGSPVPEILQARTLEWVAISFSNAWKWKVKVKSLSHVWLLATPWTVAYQAPPWDFPGKSTGVMMPSQTLITVNLSSKLFQELGTMLGIHTVYHILLVWNHKEYGSWCIVYLVRHSNNLYEWLRNLHKIKHRF